LVLDFDAEVRRRNTNRSAEIEAILRRRKMRP